MLLLAVFVMMMRPFWVPAGLAAVTVILCYPIHLWIERKVRYRYLAAAITLLGVLSFIVTPLAFIITTIVNEMLRFSQTTLERLMSGNDGSVPLAQRVDDVAVWVSGQLSRWNFQMNLRDQLVTTMREAAHFLYQFSPKVISSTANVGMSFMLGMVFMFGFFAEGGRLYRFLADISPLSERHEAIMVDEIRSVIHATLLGALATAAANALLIAIYFWISPLERPLMWGLITFGLSFVPVIGAFMIWAGAGVFLLLTGEVGWGIGIIVMGFVVIAQTDNVIKPIVMRGKVNVHPLLLLLSLLGGATFFGPSGLIFGPVFMAILLAALRIYHREWASE